MTERRGDSVGGGLDGRILDMAPAAILHVDADGRLTFANPMAETALGFSASHAAGRPISELIGDDSMLWTLLSKARAHGGRLTDHNVQLASAHGGWAEASAMIGLDPFDRSAVIVLTPGPTTTREPGFLGDLRTFARTFAHEVKNPLAGVVGAAQLLLRRATDQDKELLELIRDEARRIARLADRFASMEAYTAPIVTAQNIHAPVERAMELARRAFPEGVVFEDDYDPSLPAGMIDADHIQEAVLNLLKNAAEAIRGRGRAGRIRISTRYRPGVRFAVRGGRSGAIEILVEDDGPGLPQDNQGRIFEPFFTTKKTGTGVGLAVVAEIVKAHGGGIEVKSRPGRTRFYLLLPLAGRTLEAAQ